MDESGSPTTTPSEWTLVAGGRLHRVRRDTHDGPLTWAITTPSGPDSTDATVVIFDPAEAVQLLALLMEALGEALPAGLATTIPPDGVDPLHQMTAAQAWRLGAMTFELMRAARHRGGRRAIEHLRDVVAYRRWDATLANNGDEHPFLSPAQLGGAAAYLAYRLPGGDDTDDEDM